MSPAEARLESPRNLQKLFWHFCTYEGKRNRPLDSSGDDFWHLPQGNGGPYHSLQTAALCPDYEFHSLESGQRSLCQLKYWRGSQCIICWVIQIEHQLPRSRSLEAFFLTCLARVWALAAGGSCEMESQRVQQGCFCGPRTPLDPTSFLHEQIHSQYWPLAMPVISSSSCLVFVVPCFLLWNKNWYCVICCFSSWVPLRNLI